MAIEIKAPNPVPYDESDWHGYTRIFLGGSIEQDTASQWQKRVVSMFKNTSDDVLLLNPRRDAWDATWKNVASNKKFREQVEWELDSFERSQARLIYFDPNTKAPISLLELGRFSDSRTYVVCPKGFWRKGNVDIVCQRYGVKQFPSLKQAVEAIKKDFNIKTKKKKPTKKK